MSSSFTQKPDLKEHMELDHEGKKPFQCSTCYASFTQTSDLKEHMESIHEGKKPQLYSKELGVQVFTEDS